MKPSESELISAAEQYVFEKNGHKFSNNNDEAGDNFASFLAGANWATEHPQQNNWQNVAMKIGEKLSPIGPEGYYNFTAEQWLIWAEKILGNKKEQK